MYKTLYILPINIGVLDKYTHSTLVISVQEERQAGGGSFIAYHTALEAWSLYFGNFSQTLHYVNSPD